MKSAFAALALCVSAVVAQTTFTIATPANVVECEPTLLTWSGGVPPYILTILPGNSPSSPALENLGTQTGTSYTWNTDIASGTLIGLTLRDSTGATVSSAAFTINAGSSNSCLSASASGAPSSSAAGGSSSSAGSSSGASSASVPVSTPKPASTTAAPSVAPSPTTPASTPGSSSASKPSSGSGTTTAAGSSSTGAASVNVANMGVAAVAGAALMAILV